MLLVSPFLMIAVGLGFVLGWRAKSRLPLKWFWAGAGVWTVGVLLKFIFAGLFNEPVLSGLKADRAVYLLFGSLYIGLLTGVFEIGVTWVAARKWKSLTLYGNRAVGVGIGAGSLEAILLGIAGITGAMAAAKGYGDIEAQMATGMIWLIGPVERIIAILCHTSSRTLVLLGVVKGQRTLFWYGFWLMTGVDAVAGFVHLSEMLGQVPLWWIELAIAPFAVASVPIIRWCLRNWPPISKEVGQEMASSPANLDSALPGETDET